MKTETEKKQEEEKKVIEKAKEEEKVDATNNKRKAPLVADSETETKKAKAFFTSQSSFNSWKTLRKTFYAVFAQ